MYHYRMDIPEYTCKDPTFDEYVIKLGIKTIENLVEDKKRKYKLILPDVPSAGSLVERYCESMELTPQIEYVEKNAIEETFKGCSVLGIYVLSPLYFNDDFEKTINPVLIKKLDEIFEKAPPLTKSLTVYRKYECPPTTLYGIKKKQVFTSDRFLSTSLSLSYLDTAIFSGKNNCPNDPDMYCRIDIMPGVRVIPLLNWFEIAQEGFCDRHSYEDIHEETQFEILLPRNAMLYKITNTDYQKEGIQIIHQENIKSGRDLDPFVPEITHHFIVSNGVLDFRVHYPKLDVHVDLKTTIQDDNVISALQELDIELQQERERIKLQKERQIIEEKRRLDMEKESEERKLRESKKRPFSRREIEDVFIAHDEEEEENERAREVVEYARKMHKNRKAEQSDEEEEWEDGGSGGGHPRKRLVNTQKRTRKQKLKRRTRRKYTYQKFAKTIFPKHIF